MALNLKSLLFVSLFIALVAAPIAEATVPIRLIQIQGSVFCNLNGTMLVNGIASPPFSNALVQLRCGPANLIVSFAITDRDGVFSNLAVFPRNLSLTSLLSTCNLLVNTPLSRCNSTLPSVGRLRSPIRFIGNVTLGLNNILNVTIVGPVGFTLVA
ncbi:hypothetical protein EZV62_000302 [Acer yangbiense]|uniref:Phylloplanin-like n=1 Tax=Acer yangbiense TaxID=1000413 RepID=A0A5C7IQR2_9ROSI|nr:hypothetical protein EZV62_000302 [Acer yangbiense]